MRAAFRSPARMLPARRSPARMLPARLATLLAVASLALLTLSPAAAHEGFDEGAPLGAGSVHVAVGEDAPLVAQGVPLVLRARTDLVLPLEARLTDPAGQARPWSVMWRDAVGPPAVYSLDIVLDAPGAWTLDVRAGADVASFTFEAWPGADAFAEPLGDAATRGIVLRDEPATLQYALVDAKHAPVAPPADAVARVAGPEGVEEHALRADGDLLTLDATWATEGQRSIEILSESLAMREGTAPAFTLLVIAPEEAATHGLANDGLGDSGDTGSDVNSEEDSDAGRGMPFAGAPLVVAAIGIAALAAALVPRRLTRGRP